VPPRTSEVAWPCADAVAVIEVLADAGRVVLGLGPDLRTCDADGSIMELAWSAFEGKNADDARVAALAAVRRDDMPREMDWAFVTS
jgi:hypothetical protein